MSADAKGRIFVNPREYYQMSEEQQQEFAELLASIIWNGGQDEEGESNGK